MIKNILLCSMTLLIPLMSRAEDSKPYSGTIYPPENAPQFVKQQWQDVVDNAQFPMPKRTWKEVGLPGGLEKQVWDARAPDAPALWKSVGPGYLNVAWYDQKIDNGVISLALDLGGLVQSKDGGKTWKTLSHHLTDSHYYSFDISPANPEIMAIAGTHIDHSLNGGRSWNPVLDSALPAFSSNKIVPGQRFKNKQIAYGMIRFNADGSKVFTSPGAFGHGYANRYGIEPEMRSWLKRKYIYVGDGKVSNFKSIDLGPFAGVRCMMPHFSDPNLLYVAYSDGTFFVCRNAKAENPSFTKLEFPEDLKKFQVISMDISPDDPSTLLLCLLEQHNDNNNVKRNCPMKLVVAKVTDDKLNCKEINTGNFRNVSSAKWNPHNSQQVFLGQRGSNICVSNDGMKTFKKVDVLNGMISPVHTTGYKGTHKIEFDRKSDLAIITSVTGGWTSRDQFKTLENMVMVEDQANNWYGNKGVAFAECCFPMMRKNYTYIDTNDHGAWRSNGQDHSKWKKISDNPGMPKLGYFRLTHPMAVSEDEACIYLVGRLDNWGKTNQKLMVSHDKGDTWKDVTTLLGMGDIIKGGIQQIWFDPADSNNQWIIADNNKKLFFSNDGGKSFKSTPIPFIREIAWDSLHKKLYITTSKGLSRSLDYGMTWTQLPIIQNACYGVGVLSNGDLVVSDDGRLMVIPYSKIDNPKIDPSMIRMTIGEKIANAACGQRTFRPIVCDGMNILTLVDNGWNTSSCVRGLGPLLSRDGGKNFEWIVYDIPTIRNNVAIRDNKVMIGGRGLYELDLNSIKGK